MTIEALDQFTMWTAFAYGAVMFFILDIPFVKPLESRVPELFLILRRHQPMALFCLWFGGFWIAQEIFLRA